jgi:hypothetical protein
MTPLIFASAMALFRATLSSPDPLFPTDGTAGGPVPVNGLWAGLPVDCAAPTSLDLSTWPKCATPVGFLDGQIAVLEKPGPGKRATTDQYYSVARTKFWSIKPAAAGAPAIVQVDIPILFAASTIYIAVQPDAVDDSGGFVAAKGWPVGCPPTPVDGVTQDGKRCTAATAEGVRAAAAMQPEASKLYRLVRINAADAPSSPATGPSSTAAPGAQSPADSLQGPSTATPPSTPPTATPGQVTENPLPPATAPTPH